MSKKKKAKKRFNKPSTSTSTSQVKAATAAADAPATAKRAKASSAPAATPSAIKADPRWGYVGRDVRRIAVLATICVGIELALWLLFSRTSLGSNVYQLIKL